MAAWRSTPVLVAAILLCSGCRWEEVGDDSAGTRPTSIADQVQAVVPASVALTELVERLPTNSDTYDRDLFGQRWSDDVVVDGGHNGCDTRNDILRRDLGAAAIKPGTQGCVAASGTLQDPYTGTTIEFVRGPDSGRVQIEHVVALANSWISGAAEWDADRRADFANDPLNLLAVDGPTNQAKGAADAGEWLPPYRPYRCAYVARQIAVKHTYHLSVTTAEKQAMADVLASCPGQQLPTKDEIKIPAGR